MRPLFTFLVLATLAGCSSGNVRSANDVEAPPAPPVLHPDYDPYAAYGQANATWQPPIHDRRSTIVKPIEPSSLAGRPDYEHAPWATGASGGNPQVPLGTF
jgi:hypothetical protein